jgi:hypothetical protein
MLPKDSSIVDAITEKCKEEYSSRPLICIVEKDQQLEMKTKLAGEEFKFFDTDDLRDLPNYNKGILLLDSTEYRGLNTPFDGTALVLVGCVVTRESQYHQMQGRSSRSRGVCNAFLYVNTGEKESLYR